MSKRAKKKSSTNSRKTLFVIDLLPTHTRVDLDRFVRDLGPQVISGRIAPALLTINGYNHDPRELWQIPEVRALCQRVEASGLISLLHLNLDDRLEMVLGAWDVYALARGLVRSYRVELTPEHLTDFKRVLGESNRVVDRMLEKAS